MITVRETGPGKLGRRSLHLPTFVFEGFGGSEDG